MSEELIVTLSGNLKVKAMYKGFDIMTDQPKYAGGDGTAPQPFDLFLASLGTCAGVYVIHFCLERKIPYEDIRITMNMTKDEKTKGITKISLDINLTDDFPEKYRKALIRAVDLCAVTRTIRAQPEIEVITTKLCRRAGD